MELASDGEEDVVVRELDVYLSKPDLGPNTQFCLLQSPLRPAWRPYNYEKPYDEVRYKPIHRRLELKVPLSTKPENFNKWTADSRAQIDHITLSSSVMDTHGAYALGSIRGDALYLTPIDCGFQLRPNLDHLNVEVPDEKPPVPEVKKEAEEDDGAYKTLKVAVKRRETEWQHDTRVRSYAYLKAEEEKECWQRLMAHSADSPEAEVLWEQLSSAVEDPLPFTSAPDQYLAALSPGSALLSMSSVTEGAVEGAAAMSSPAGPAVVRRVGAGPVLAPQVGAHLPQLMADLFARQHVINLEDVRNQMMGHEAAEVQQAAAAQDGELRKIIAACPNVLDIRGVYVAKEAGPQHTQAFRTLLLQELSGSTALKKAELREAAEAKNIPLPSERDVVRLLKELCTSRGAYWSLKSGTA